MSTQLQAQKCLLNFLGLFSKHQFFWHVSDDLHFVWPAGKFSKYFRPDGGVGISGGGVRAQANLVARSWADMLAC